MKKCLVLVVATVMCFACGSDYNFTIKGEISPAAEGSVVLYNYVNGVPEAIDTSLIEGGKFTFKGNIDVPDIYLIGMADNPNKYIAQLFLEASDIKMTIYPDSLDANVVVGSKSEDILSSYFEEMVEFQKKEGELRQRFGSAQMSNDKATMDALQFEFEGISKNRDLYARNFVSEYMDSPVAAFVYLKHFYRSASLEELDSMLTIFDASIAGSQFNEVIRKRVEVLKTSCVGAVAPDFTLNGVEGDSISLSSFRGKVVLIDFWASWCKPCVASMPAMVSLYADYKDKGFEILGVSLDRDPNSWKGAIANLGITWPQVWALEDGIGDVAMKYDVSGIPFVVLVDKDGVILSRQAMDEVSMREKLDELLGE